MTVRKLDDGKPKLWLAEVYPQGRDGPRKRKRFATKGEALAWEKWLLEESNSNPWLTANKVTEDKRRLSWPETPTRLLIQSLFHRVQQSR